MAFDERITCAADLKDAMTGDGYYQACNNAIVAARLSTPPPAKVMGLAPAGAYDAHCGYTSLEKFPVAAAFKYALPAPARFPELKQAFNSGEDQRPSGPTLDLERFDV